MSLGPTLWNTLDGKVVLECGCGAGRFTEVLLERGAIVHSIDISDAVDADADNCPLSDKHQVAQADILRLPFVPQQFDIVLCLGVIQSTPSPEETVTRLYAQVKSGGALVMDHYTHNLSWYTKTAPLFRHVLKRLPIERGIKITEWLVRTLLPLHKATRHFRVGQMILSRVSPVLCYYRAYPELADDLQREWALVDTHDSLTDWYKYFRPKNQIRRCLEGLGLNEVYSVYAGNGVEARGKRPLN